MENKTKCAVTCEPVKPLIFNPKELDFTFLRKLPEINIATQTAIPKRVLERATEGKS